jgi:hypothetical protein
MKKKSKTGSAVDDELEIPPTPPDFFKRATMGKYYRDYVSRRGHRPVIAVTLEEDVAEVFRDSASVNDLLRAVIRNLPRASVAKRRKSA